MKLENEINLGPPAITTDVEKYMHLLMDCYNDGFSLVTFVRVPEVHMSTDFTSLMSDQRYQAILTKDNVIGYVWLRFALHTSAINKHIGLCAVADEAVRNFGKSRLLSAHMMSR